MSRYDLTPPKKTPPTVTRFDDDWMRGLFRGCGWLLLILLASAAVGYLGTAWMLR